ncbi:cytochrome c assembly protein [Xylanibacillus composti]|uniref:Cytochrome c assembly protein n=1 Tax=Xylanibacillus composti TaxID=1572762 RepID=A0A8J4M2T3_9BACL|nr:cytochrome c biogenesis protein CcsA [Xylanibacillus composti]GIQ70200.1 cytochrome c assembly protein [Xylanibacillus composti]
MITNNWMFDIILYLYALSLLFFFSDFLRHDRHVKQTGTGLLAFVWLLKAAFFFTRMFAGDYVPVLTMFETLFFFAWVLVTLTLVFSLSKLFSYDLLVFVLSCAGFMVLVLALFNNEATVPSGNRLPFSDKLLMFHIIVAICSYASFTLSAVFAGLYLFIHQRLKSKRWSVVLQRAPSLDRVEKSSFVTAVIGMSLLLLSLLLGIGWIIVMGDWTLAFDPKVLSSLLLLAVYAAYLVQRASAKWSSWRLAQLNLGAYAVIILNFVVSMSLSNFHSWVWR